jgi:hypothetical protein
MLIELRHRFRLIPLLVVAALIGSVAVWTVNASAATFAAPITITKGGTYSGNWRSTTTAPAVTVLTSEPVTIQNCEVQGKGNLIAVNAMADVTVRNCRGEGTWSGTSGSGRMLWAASGVKNVVFEHNEVVKAAGLKVINARPQKVTVRYNRADNIMGDPTNCCGFMQFAQFDNVVGGDVELAWNRIVNQPEKSRVEDVVNFFNSGGTSGRLWKVHHNLIWGAFPEHPTTEQGFSGGGIMLGDGIPSGSDRGYVEAYSNTVLGSANYLLSVAGGSGNYVHDNLALSSGRLADGSTIANLGGGGPVGLALWSGPTSSSAVRNNKVVGNRVGMWKPLRSQRNDWWWDTSSAPASAGNDMSGNTSLAGGAIPYSAEVDAAAQWDSSASGLQIGRASGSAPTTTSPTTSTTTAPSTTTTTAAPLPSSTTTTTAPAPPATTPSSTDKTPTGPSGAASYNIAISTLAPTTATNGWGPYEPDRSNGEDRPDDGQTITLNGTSYRFGLGVHAPSKMAYDLRGDYRRFSSYVGIDDEEGAEASAVFEVWADGRLAYRSPTMTPNSATKLVSLDVTGVRTLELVVTDAGDGIHHDHADWADARLVG